MMFINILVLIILAAASVFFNAATAKVNKTNDFLFFLGVSVVLNLLSQFYVVMIVLTVLVGV